MIRAANVRRWTRWSQRVCGVVAVMAAAPWVIGARPAAQERTSLEQLFARYGAGDQASVARAAASGGLRSLRGQLPDVIGRWQPAWDIRHSALLLELALAGFESGQSDAAGFVVAARELATSRPAAPGVRPDQDALEILLHRAAVGILTAYASDEAEAYVFSLGARVAATPSTDGPRLIEPRIALSRAIVFELRAQSNFVRLSRPTDLPPSRMGPAQDTAQTVRMRRAVQAFAIPAAAPATRAEASVRSGLLAHRLGDHTRALALFDIADAATDPAVRYWSALFRGHTLDALHRTDDAVEAYGQAATLWPTAQTPAVALSALLVRANRYTDAYTAAARARATPGAPADPWWQYWNGDLRFVPSLLATLREARP